MRDELPDLYNRNWLNTSIFTSPAETNKTHTRNWRSRLASQLQRFICPMAQSGAMMCYDSKKTFGFIPYSFMKLLVKYEALLKPI